MIIVLGNDPATTGAAEKMAVDTYGPRVKNHSEAAAELETGQNSVHIVAHHEPGGNLGGQRVAQVVEMLVGTFRLFDNKARPAKFVWLHACYSNDFATQLKTALTRALIDKGIHFVKVYGTNGLNVIDLERMSRVIQPNAFGQGPEQDWKGFQAAINDGGINASRWKSTIEPHLFALGQGWQEH